MIFKVTNAYSHSKWPGSETAQQRLGVLPGGRRVSSAGPPVRRAPPAWRALWRRQTAPFFRPLARSWGSAHHGCWRLCTARALNGFMLAPGLEKASQRKKIALKLHVKEGEWKAMRIRLESVSPSSRRWGGVLGLTGAERILKWLTKERSRQRREREERTQLWRIGLGEGTGRAVSLWWRKSPCDYHLSRFGHAPRLEPRKVNQLTWW